MKRSDNLPESPRLIQLWARSWNTPDLAEQVTCEWSSRLRSSLGRAFPERMLVRLNTLLKEPSYVGLFKEVLCHEVAHLAVFHVHGSRAAVHGPEWRELVNLAGYEPRLCYRTDSLSEQQVQHPVRYEHVCPVCQSKRTAKLPQPRWRCIPCRNAGLEGELIIQSRPHPRVREAFDA